MRFFIWLALASAALTGRLAAQGQEVSIQWGVKIPLRDGVRLNATVYRPRNATGPLPVVFTLTPYIGDTYHGFAMAMARDGYDVVEWFWGHDQGDAARDGDQLGTRAPIDGP